MADRAEATAHGAATIVSALATGRGAALGVDLWTRATVELTDRPGEVVGRILSDPSEDTRLMEECVRLVLSRYRAGEKFGAVVETDSNIPIARGLKSSSAASNAVVLATVRALGRRASDIEVVKMGVEASRMAGVTKTGAFDDACASYFGHVYVTDNRRTRVLRRFRIESEMPVLFHLGGGKRYTADVDMDWLRPLAPVIESVHREAVAGRYWRAMTLNGLAFAAMLGLDSGRIADALRSGAIAAGLSGKGPAVAAVVPGEKVDAVREAWKKYEGEILTARINLRKASASP